MAFIFEDCSKVLTFGIGKSDVEFSLKFLYQSGLYNLEFKYKISLTMI